MSLVADSGSDRNRKTLICSGSLQSRIPMWGARACRRFDARASAFKRSSDPVPRSGGSLTLQFKQTSPIQRCLKQLTVPCQQKGELAVSQEDAATRAVLRRDQIHVCIIDRNQRARPDCPWLVLYAATRCRYAQKSVCNAAKRNGLSCCSDPSGVVPLSSARARIPDHVEASIGCFIPAMAHRCGQIIPVHSAVERFFLHRDRTAPGRTFERQSPPAKPFSMRATKALGC